MIWSLLSSNDLSHLSSSTWTIIGAKSYVLKNCTMNNLNICKFCIMVSDLKIVCERIHNQIKCQCSKTSRDICKVTFNLNYMRMDKMSLLERQLLMISSNNLNRSLYFMRVGGGDLWLSHCKIPNLPVNCNG